MRNKIFIVLGVLAVMGAIAAGIVYANLDTAIKLASMAVNYVKYLNAPAGTTVTELAPGYKGAALALSPAAEATRLPQGGAEDWPSYNRTLTSQRYVALDQINKSNVAQLKPICTYDLGMQTEFETGPLVIGDTLYEPNETLYLNLSTATYATIGRSQALGTIVNDDPLPTVSVADASVTEGNSGTTPFVFTVSLDKTSASTVTVQFATQDGTASTGNGDYVATSGTLTFLPGVTSQQVTVNVNGDSAVEPDETFFVNLSNPSANAIITTSQAKGTIVNDDGGAGTPTISIADVSKAEGNSGVTPFSSSASTLAPRSSSSLISGSLPPRTA